MPIEETKSKAKPVNQNYQRDKDREVVKGIFRYFEVPGGAIEFVYKAYKGDEVEKYMLIDGQVYSLPLGVARHLNKNGWYPEYEYLKGDTTGTKVGFGPTSGMRVAKKVRRYAFQSLEFVDIEDLGDGTKQILTVEEVPVLGK